MAGHDPLWRTPFEVMTRRDPALRGPHGVMTGHDYVMAEPMASHGTPMAKLPLAMTVMVS